MTEDEAKTKWCPFARYVSIRGEGINRWIHEGETQTNPEPSRCIASDCMAWRWTTAPDRAESYAREAPRAHREHPFVAKGHCGLAGGAP